MHNVQVSPTVIMPRPMKLVVNWKNYIPLKKGNIETRVSVQYPFGGELNRRYAAKPKLHQGTSGINRNIC